MAKESGQKFIRRVRPPRVHITYENPANAEEKVEIPFIMGVMADLSGNAPGDEKPEIVNRKFLEFDMDNPSNSTWTTWMREWPPSSRASTSG